jgi:hypothetical protein
MTNCTDVKDVIDCLRAADINVIQTANGNIGGEDFFGLFQYVPVVDGSLIQDSLVATITSGRLNGVRPPSAIFRFYKLSMDAGIITCDDQHL